MKSLGSLKSGRQMVSVIFEPFLPRILLTASCRFILSASSPSILIILSPDLMPALSAGVLSIGETTVRILFLIDMTMPTPSNSPDVSDCMSLKLSGSR
ncbi:MAG: hypothetical protein ACD_47C00556G0002 [uncultured bacterium]|nr:MAG: hypothetical protein ACD_47C00556G0002 [uncultured bacterium]